jgi:2-alkenal reductase
MLFKEKSLPCLSSSESFSLFAVQDHINIINTITEKMVKRKILFIALAFTTLFIAACTALQNPSITRSVRNLVPTNGPQVLNPSTVDQEQTLIELYRRANPAVVNVTTFMAEAKPDAPGNGMGQGSGFLYDSQGRIVTNNHVVENAIRVEVTFSDDTTQEARILGVDPDSDLAVLEVDMAPTEIQPLSLGDSDALQVGQTVAAIGNPFGLEGTLTTGIVSSLGRVVPSGLSQFFIPQVIQTDAAINPGNSGGPLLNLQGEVVGVNTQILTGDGSRANSGVGFAVPSNIIAKVAPSLIDSGSYTWPWLGVRGGTLSATIAKANDLGELRGAYIAEVLPNGPAAKAGLRGADREVEVDGLRAPVGGDVVQAVDGQAIVSFDDLLEYIALRSEVGQTLKLTIIRDGQEQTIEVTLEARPGPEEANS